MPIATGVLHKTTGWGRPKIDLGGCVLYLPLWRPSSDMTGSTIYSYDNNRHVCTVTGTTWGVTGRTFDGTDDSIIIPYNAAYDVVTEITIMAWTKPNTSNYGLIICRDETTTRLWKIDHNVNFFHTLIWEGGVQTIKNTATNYPNGAWYHIALTFANGGRRKFYVNGNLILDDAVTGNLPQSALIGLALGIRMGGLTEDYNGIIGEAWFHTKEVSQAEVQQNYQVTKWRYQ